MRHDRIHRRPLPPPATRPPPPPPSCAPPAPRSAPAAHDSGPLGVVELGGVALLVPPLCVDACGAVVWVVVAAASLPRQRIRRYL